VQNYVVKSSNPTRWLGLRVCDNDATRVLSVTDLARVAAILGKGCTR
jgi:hypothetical protein